MRTVDELIESGLKTIHWGYCHGASVMRPLLSGGHDSIVACHLASQHERFAGSVHHIDTGIGARYTRQHVERFCDRIPNAASRRVRRARTGSSAAVYVGVGNG